MKSNSEKVMNRFKMLPKFLLLTCAFALLGSGYAQDAVHAVAGAVTKIDKTGKTIAVKTADGAEQTFKYTERTGIRDRRETAQAAKIGAVDTYFAGKEGTHVVVRYMGKGADKTATMVEDFGKVALKTGKGTVTHVDRATHSVVVKGDDGAEATYNLGSQAVVETDQGVVRGTHFIVKEGDKVVVHYTEAEGSKVIHLFKKL
jgi:hypothetical protein